MILLDTHVVLWLYTERDRTVSASRGHLEGSKRAWS